MSYYTSGERLALQQYWEKREAADAEGDVKNVIQACQSIFSFQLSSKVTQARLLNWANKNFESIDGLPGLDIARANMKKGVATMSGKQREQFRLQRLPSASRFSNPFNAVSKDLLAGVLLGAGGLLVAQLAVRWMKVETGLGI